MRLRHIACLLTVACFAQLSTGCYLIRNTFWRIRNHFGCNDCSPMYHQGGTPVMSDPYAGVQYGAPNCTNCGYGNSMPGQPVSLGSPPNVTISNPPSMPLPKPMEPEKKN